MTSLFFADVSIFLLTSSKIRQNRKSSLCLNEKSWRNGSPLIFLVLGNSLQKNTFRWPERYHFCWRQHFFCSKSGNHVIWRHVTSRRYHEVKCVFLKRASHNRNIEWWTTSLPPFVRTQWRFPFFVGFLMTSSIKCWRQQKIMTSPCRKWLKN